MMLFFVPIAALGMATAAGWSRLAGYVTPTRPRIPWQVGAAAVVLVLLVLLAAAAVGVWALRALRADGGSIAWRRVGQVAAGLVGLVLIVFPEPLTTLGGLAMVLGAAGVEAIPTAPTKGGRR